MNALQEALLNPDINDPLKLPRTILQGFSDAYKKAKGESNWTGSLRKPEGYTPPKAVTTVEGSAENLVSPKELGVTRPTTLATPTTTKAPTETTTEAPAETTNASTSAVQGATNSQADALSNNVNEGENKAKQTMTVQSGSDMGGVNYTNAGGKSTTATTSSDDVMPQSADAGSATPTNQKYNSWMQNASTFGTSDENEKRSPEGSLKEPLTLTKTVYWSRRKK